MSGRHFRTVAGFPFLLMLLLGLPAVCGAPREDAPLDRPGDLQLRTVSLEELCCAMSTGETRFIPDARETGDYKVHALLREVRLQEAMTAITRLFTLPDADTGLTWVRRTNGSQVTYRLAARVGLPRRAGARCSRALTPSDTRPGLRRPSRETPGANGSFHLFRSA